MKQIPSSNFRPPADEINDAEPRFGGKNASRGLKYAVCADGKTCEITGIGTCMDDTVVIPAVLDGYTVTGIARNAFRYCRRFTEVVIPDSVLTVGERAFAECKPLLRVTLGGAVESIGVAAFGNCTSLISLALPASVRSIGERAFSGVGRILVSPDNPNYSSVEGTLYSKDGGTLLHYAGDEGETSFCVPGSVCRIGAMAFYRCTSLTEVHIPGSVTDIDEYAFCGCTGLSRVAIPDSVQRIGEGAFAGVGEVYFTASNPCYTSVGGAVYTKDGKTLLHFAANGNEKEFTVPETVTAIGNGACYFCDSLVSAVIPNSVTRIGENAFWSCKNLTEISLGDSVTTIGRYAFKACGSLRRVTLPASLTFIGEKAFLFCPSLSAVCYRGTRMQWKKVRLEEFKWRYESAIRALECADGTIEYLF